MLLDFSFENYFSFRESGHIDLALSGGVPEQISQGRGYSTAICIKGANASGKTNVLRAISFMCRFAADSFQAIPDSAIPIDSFFESEEPTSFCMNFRYADVAYSYELVVTEQEVISEKLFRSKKKKVLIVSRTRELLACNAKFARLKTMKLRKNVSFISMARQHDFGELDDVYTFFRTVLTNVSYGGMTPDFGTEEKVAKLYKTHPEMLEIVVDFLRKCDTGITSINILEQETSSGDPEFFPIFYHGIDQTRPVTSHTESSGTRALFRKLAGTLLILKSGGVLVADEIDINLHPHLLKKVVQLFLDEDTNPKGAQLIFTTHNNEVMDLLGRYRTFLVGKSENESFVYRLDEIPGDLLRNDRPIAPIYDQGRIGGVPKA